MNHESAHPTVCHNQEPALTPFSHTSQPNTELWYMQTGCVANKAQTQDSHRLRVKNWIEALLGVPYATWKLMAIQSDEAEDSENYSSSVVYVAVLFVNKADLSCGCGCGSG